MKKLKVDLDLLYQSFVFDNEDLCKEYLDTDTGDIVNVPIELERVILGEAEEEDLEDWQRELLQEAYSVAEDKRGRFILIENINPDYLGSDIEGFIEKNIASEELKSRLKKMLEDENALRNFKNALSDFPEELEKWYDYQEQKGKEYVIDWLRERKLQIAYIC